MSEDVSTSLSRAEFDIENNWVGKGGGKWSIIPNSMCKTNTSLFITIFVKSLLSSSGLCQGSRMRKRQGKEFCKVFALHFIFYFYFLLFFIIVVVFVIHGHESAIVPFTLISLIQILLCCPQAPSWTQRNHPKICFYQVLSLSHSAFYISSLCNAIIILFFFLGVWGAALHTAHDTAQPMHLKWRICFGRNCTWCPAVACKFQLAETAGIAVQDSRSSDSVVSGLCL